MNIRLLQHKNFPGAIYCILLFWSMVFCIPSSAQKNPPGKAKTSKTSKPSNNRVIYGLASFYANKFEGRRTSSGEIFSQSKYTCACNMLPVGTWVMVTNVRNGRTVVVKVNDRLHPRMRRVADLSKAAAHKLGYLSWGVTRVKVEVLGKVKPF